MTRAILIAWVLWSATEIRIEKGELITRGGGVVLGPKADVLQATKPGTYWLRTGAYFDTKQECEKVRTQHHNAPGRWLLCMPNGEVPAY